LVEAGKFVTLAAWQVHWRAQALQAYIDATLKGAQRAVDVLEIAATAGQIAETVLTVIWLGQGMIRLLSTRGASEVISTVAKEGHVSAPARSTKYVEEKMYQKYIQGKAPVRKSPAPSPVPKGTPAPAGGGGSPAPAQISKSTPGPGKSPTGSPVSKSTTPSGQQPSGGSTPPSGQTGTGGSPPTPPNPTNPAATALPNVDNEWQRVVDELGALVSKRTQRIPRGEIPTQAELDRLRVRAKRLIQSGRTDPSKRDAVNELIIELDHLEIDGRLPPLPTTRAPRPSSRDWKPTWNGKLR
jgi:hypothetical protein